MRKVIHKYYGAWNTQKEEAWLNRMAAQGLCLISYSFCRYEFEDCLPGEYEIRIQLLDNPCRHPESEHYISFLEETGAEQVGSYMRWAYFRKKTADGPFELFSDNQSRSQHLSNVIPFLAVLGGANLLVGAGELFLYFYFYYNYFAPAFLVLGILNLCLGVLCTFGAFRLHRQKKRLKKEHTLFE